MVFGVKKKKSENIQHGFKKKVESTIWAFPIQIKL